MRRFTKNFADVKYGCHTLCVVPKPPKNGVPGAPLEINLQPSYLANLALKINLKLGGVNHQLEPIRNSQSSSRVMYLGIDMTHPTGTESIPDAPAHYVVLRDESSFTANELQTMTHNLSYVFGRATRSVSIATPAYYADILYEGGRCYLYDTFHRRDHLATAPYDESQSKWLWGVHEDLAETLFYL
ncbi:hypothetical protein McanMca71_005296 [Microsporum canis]